MEYGDAGGTRHGGLGGDKNKFTVNDKIVRVQGWSEGDRILQLTFTTDNGDVFGPYGKHDDEDEDEVFFDANFSDTGREATI